MTAIRWKPSMAAFAAAMGMSMLLAGCMSSLEGAVSNGRTDRVLSLLQAKPKPQDREMGLALIRASKNGHDEIVKLLLDGGADVNFGNQNTGWSPLTIAAAYQHPSTVKLLLSRGAASDGMPEFLDQYGQPQGARLLRQLAPRAPAAAAPSLETRPAIAQQPAAALSSDVDSPKYTLPENADNFAIIAGIEKYEGLPDAQFAERDARAMNDHLLALGYPPRNIRVLIGPKATGGSLAEKLNTWLPRNVNENSTVFFYYSGHGAPDPRTGQAYLVPWDGDPQSLEDTAYPLKRLYSKLDALKAKRVIVALDSCFSGAGGRSVLPRGARPLVTKVDVDAPLGGKIVSLSASAANEISGTIEEQGHGAFTYYFLKGLNGDAKDKSGQLTMKSLYDYLLPKVRDAASRQNRDQTPQLMPAGGKGDAIRLR